MKQGTLWRVTVRTLPTAGEAIADLMTTFFQSPASAYTDERTRKTDVSVYLPDRVACGEASMRRFKGALRALKQHPGGCPARVKVESMRNEDWAESWKRHFKPVVIADRILLKPSWSGRRPARRQIAITLDPGLSFGTGHHPTTACCIEEIVRLTSEVKGASMLDIGTGSGLLAIAAVKLGCSPVEAFDFDPESIRVAGENLGINGVTGAVALRQMDVKRLPLRPRRTFDLVCANLLAVLLVEEAGRITAQVRPGGRLVVAGILQRQFGEVRQAFEAQGCKLLRSKREKEWRSGTLMRG